jgi:cell division transport system ATP-binding protein
MLSFVNVSKYYQDQSAVRNVNFSINEREFVFLIGETGSGKSSILRLVSREEVPTKGVVFVDNIDTSNLKSSAVLRFRRKIGIIFQDFKLLPKKNVYENVSLALELAKASRSEIKHKVPKVLELVGLSDKSKSKINELSGGEKQRVSIARSLIHDPIMILADEPTGNLDPYTSEEIIKLLIEINSLGTTVVMATHNKDIVNSVGRRVMTMKGGQMVRDQKELGQYILD